MGKSLSDVNNILNKQKRGEVREKLKRKKNQEQSEERKKRKKDVEEGKAEKLVPQVQETKRELDETIVAPDDEEVLQDEQFDEFADYFNGKAPKIIITTCVMPHQDVKRFAFELTSVIPNAYYYRRRFYQIKDMCKMGANRDFTDLIVINADKKKISVDGLLLIHLPKGPTAHFKLTRVRLRKTIPNHAKPSRHRPELILNNFNTRLGHTLGRMLVAIFPQSPEFLGRRVVTFHNQRDFIFFRHHRYVFDSATKARLQEIGPRFTLKLRSLQHGTFDSSGEYIWMYKSHMSTSRRRFFM